MSNSTHLHVDWAFDGRKSFGRIVFFALSILITLNGARARGMAAESNPLNIVVLYADDWRFDTLGCAGNPVVKTPHLDRLASEGIRFTHACVTTSICGVSRASPATAPLIATGLTVAVASGFIAGLSPAWTAARAEIVSGLRN